MENGEPGEEEYEYLSTSSILLYCTLYQFFNSSILQSFDPSSMTKTEHPVLSGSSIKHSWPRQKEADKDKVNYRSRSPPDPDLTRQLIQCHCDISLSFSAEA